MSIVFRVQSLQTSRDLQHRCLWSGIQLPRISCYILSAQDEGDMRHMVCWCKCGLCEFVWNPLISATFMKSLRHVCFKFGTLKCSNVLCAPIKTSFHSFCMANVWCAWAIRNALDRHLPRIAKQLVRGCWMPDQRHLSCQSLHVCTVCIRNTMGNRDYCVAHMLYNMSGKRINVYWHHCQHVALVSSLCRNEVNVSTCINIIASMLHLDNDSSG